MGPARCLVTRVVGMVVGVEEMKDPTPVKVTSDIDKRTKFIHMDVLELCFSYFGLRTFSGHELSAVDLQPEWKSNENYQR